MQSNDSPELSSAYSSYSHQDASTTEVGSSNASRKKSFSPKARKSPNRSVSSTPHSNDKDMHHKRSSLELNSDDETKDSHSAPAKSKRNKMTDKPKSLKTNRKSQNQNQFSEKIGAKMKGRNGSAEPTNSKGSVRLTDDDDNSSDFVAPRKKSPFTVSKSHYSKSLNLTAQTGSIEEGQKLFGVLIKPIPVTTFMSQYWEKKPIRVERHCPSYFKEVLSTEAIDEMLRENHLEFTKNIDITQYKDGVRETLNPIGRASAPVVWDFYSKGCSVRVLNPQKFLPAIHSMNATLQEYFQCMTGANIYLTPPNSQGFAPHYDDIEAFVLQIEGKKHWRVYKPRSRNECLPRESSKNLEPSEIGELCLEVVLEAGDSLYFPRGYVHQANTVDDCHSLHITLSVYQKQTFADLLEILIPMAMKEAFNENLSLREGLPLNIWQCMGLVNSDNYYPERDGMIKRIKTCFETVCRYVKADSALDNAVDQMALKYQRDALPPKLTSDEELRSVYSTKATVTADGEMDFPFIEANTKIRLIRGNVLRMVRHGDEIRVYYSSENTMEYHEFEENFLEISPSNAPAVEVLIKAYPTFITPAQLQLEDDDSNLSVAQYLWERGMLMTDEPLV